MGKPIGHYKNESEIWDELAKTAPIFKGISYNRLEEKTIQWPCPEADHPGTHTLFTERFNTPNGLGKLHPVDYVPQSERVSEAYPLLLNTGRILYQYHSSTMSRKNKSLNDYANECYLLMHPDDAGKQGLKEGEKVMVSSARGQISTILRISEEVLPGELFMPFHYAEAPVNKLTRDDLDPYSKIAPFKLSAVQVRRVV
jgi:predicted molibdopterin-dependent oxidoreductase YjgC